MYCAHSVKTARPFPVRYPDGRLARWVRLGRPRPSSACYVGSELVCADCFARRSVELRLERVEMARELTLARLLPFADVLSALDAGETDGPELREMALVAIMETV